MEEPMNINYNNDLSKENNEIKKDENISDYLRLIAAQNESKRRFKFRQLNKTLKEENEEKRICGILMGIFGAGIIAATALSGTEPNIALDTELKIMATGSFESIKEHLSYITPAMWTSAFGFAVSLADYIRHAERYNKANDEFYDLVNTDPTNYLESVESDAKTR